MIQNLKNLLITVRLFTSSIAGITVFIMLCYSHKNISIDFFLHGMVFFLVTAYGFVINDIFDYKKDKLAKRKRPIAQDKLNRKTATSFALMIILLTILLEFLLKDSAASFLVVQTTLLLLTIYSLLSFNFPLLKGFITGILSITPLIYVSTIINIHFNYVVYLIVLFYIFGRELFMDAQDYKGDILSNLKTIPYYLGIQNSKLLGILLMLLGSIILVIMNLNTFETIGSFLSILSLFIMFISLFSFHKNEEKALNLTKISMLFSIIPIFNIAI